MLTRLPVAAALVLALFGPAGVGFAQDKKETKKVDAEEKSFKSADGVKLRGLFYKAAKGGAAPVVLMLHAYKQNPDEAVWDETAQLLVGKGYNVFRFDFRGHGKSTDIVPADFFDLAKPWGAINRRYVALGQGLNFANKLTVKFTDFKPAYFPMLVQDIAAARNTLDQMNDTGEVNTSTVYLLGAGDAVDLGFLFAASEWLREAKKPNVAVAANVVSPNRPLFQNADSAGPDIGGAVWISPAPRLNGGITLSEIKGWTLSPFALNLRVETPMLFVYAEKDRTGTDYAQKLYSQALVAKGGGVGPGGVKIQKLDQTFLFPIKGSGATGLKLLGNTLGTEEQVDKFLAAVNKERKDKTRQNRGWDKPLYIEVHDFGLCRN